MALVPTSLCAQSPGPAPQTPTIALYNYAPYQATPNYVRFGAPILFSGRILPADATGTLTYSVDNIPTQTVALAPQSPGEYIALGDSITYAGYIADPTQRYQSLVGQALNLNVSSYASPGYTACDEMLLNVIPNNVGITTTSRPLYSLLIGTNDLAQFGVGPGEALFNLCHQAALTWLGVARQNKILIGDAGVTIQSGTWTSSAAFSSCCLSQLTNTAGTGTVRFTFTTSGGAAYLWYLVQAATAGSFAVSVDSGPPGSATSTLMMPTLDTVTSTYALLRIPVAAGTHTFDIAAQSGTVTLFGMGTAPPAGPSSTVPTVIATDVINALNGPTPGIPEYTSDIQANVALLHSDGLDIRFAPTRGYMLGTPAEMMDSRHPNALGLSELAQAIEAVVTPSSPAQDTLPVARADFSTNSLAIGSHTIDVAYSGDQKYAPAYSGTNMVIYDASSTTTVTSDAPIYPVQTPITLTAAVPQANANGSVTFIDATASGNVTLGSAWINGIVFGSAQLTLPSLPAGQHTLLAQYAGDVHYNGSSSAAIRVNVSGSYTTTTLSAPGTKYFGGTAIPLTATIAPAYASGTVAFLDGTSVLSQAQLVNGVANFNATALATGLHALSASFSGNTTQDSSQSPVLSIEIDSNPTTVALSSLPASVPYGTATALQATVSPTSATGTVSFTDSFVPSGQAGTQAVSQPLGQPALTNGVAALTLASLAPGTHSIAAAYSGDAFDLPSLSSTVVTQITLDASTTTLAPIPATLTYGTTLTLTASIGPAASTGTVTFTDSIAGTLAQLPIVNGSATFSTASLAPGAHSVSAAYSGDSFRGPSTSAALSTTINPIASSIVLAQPPATVYAGNPLSLSATIAPAAATGTVLFRDATFGVLGQATVAHGIANLTLTNPATGTYTITAAYSGDSDNTPATSNAVTTQVILTATTTTLTTSAPSVTVGAPLTLTASVSVASATGTIVFFDGASSIGSALAVNGQASLVVSSFAPGIHTLHATYSGDALNAASSSANITQTVTSGITSTTLTLAQNSVIAGTSLTFNVKVATSYTTPTGTITIRSGSHILASGPVANAVPGAGYATLTVNSATLGLGTFAVAAYYSGDADDQLSDSSATPLSVTVLAIPTAATLTLSAAQVPVQGSVTLTVTVTSAATPPTGSVAILNNGNSIATAQLNASGIATVSIPAPPIGSYTLTAAYTPTGLFAAATSGTQALIVTRPLTASFSPSTITAARGTTANATLLLTPLSGFSGSIQTLCQTTSTYLTCSLNAPANVAGPVNIPVQIAIAKNIAASATPTRPGTFRTASAAALVLLLPFCLRRRPNLRLVSLVFAYAIGILYLGGCAEGGDFNAVPPGPQTVAITITAAATPYTSDLTVNISQ
jgi:hypothetical protein